jgi:tetratricopeptide (TPR) repeat protein
MASIPFRRLSPVACRLSPVVFSFVALCLAPASLGCSEVRGRKKIQEANELYKRGRYQEAVAAFEEAEPLVPNLPTLWLNKGYTCRQLIAPGGRDPESRRAAACALAAFRRLKELAPNDARAEQLTVQTWFDTDDFQTLETIFLERNKRSPDDYDVVHGLQEVYYKWGKWPQALQWSTRAATLRPNDADAQYGVGTFIWQILASHGGGPDMAAYDPRPRPPPADAPPPPRKSKKSVQADEPQLVPPPPPPPAVAGDVTGKDRIELADRAIAHLEKAIALRPHHADAMTYLALVWRQRSFALFAEPAAWQQAVDRANEWQKRAQAARAGRS